MGQSPEQITRKAQSARLSAMNLLRDYQAKYHLVGAPVVASRPASCVLTEELSSNYRGAVMMCSSSQAIEIS